MSIDPHAWLVTVPITIAMIQFWFMAEDHVIKRTWRFVQSMEQEIWFRLAIGLWRRPDAGALGVPAVVYQAIVAAFAVLSLLSFAVFVGILPL